MTIVWKNVIDNWKEKEEVGVLSIKQSLHDYFDP